MKFKYKNRIYGMVFRMENHSEKLNYFSIHRTFVYKLYRRKSQHFHHQMYVIKDQFTIEACSLSIQRDTKSLDL